MKWTPRGYGGARRPPEAIKREGWHEHGILVVSEDDQRLTWLDRELIRQLARKLYGIRSVTKEAFHD